MGRSAVEMSGPGKMKTIPRDIAGLRHPPSPAKYLSSRVIDTTSDEGIIHGKPDCRRLINVVPSSGVGDDSLMHIRGGSFNRPLYRVGS